MILTSIAFLIRLRTVNGISLKSWDTNVFILRVMRHAYISSDRGLWGFGQCDASLTGLRSEAISIAYLIAQGIPQGDPVTLHADA